MVNIEEYKIKLEVAYKSLKEGRKNKTISLKQASDLLEKVMNEGKDLTKEDVDEELTDKAAWITIEYLWINNNFCFKWKESKTHPTKEEFEIIKKSSGRFLGLFTGMRKKYPSVIDDKLYSDLKEEIKSVEDFVKQEEDYQKSPSGDNNGDDTDNNDNSNGSKGNGGGNKPLSSNNSELEEKIKGLQNQLKTVKKELKKKQQKNPNSVDSQQEERKKDELERELERLKREKEGNRQKPGNQNPQNKKDSFPYGLVIGGGIAIFLLLIAVIFFWQRSKRK